MMDSRLAQNILNSISDWGNTLGVCCQQIPRHRFMVNLCVWWHFQSFCHACPQTSPRKWWQKKTIILSSCWKKITHGLPFKQSLHVFFLAVRGPFNAVLDCDSWGGAGGTGTCSAPSGSCVNLHHGLLNSLSDFQCHTVQTTVDGKTYPNMQRTNKLRVLLDAIIYI